MDPFAFLAEAYEAWYETPVGAYVIAEEERALKSALLGDEPDSAA